MWASSIQHLDSAVALIIIFSFMQAGWGIQFTLARTKVRRQGQPPVHAARKILQSFYKTLDFRMTTSGIFATTIVCTMAGHRAHAKQTQNNSRKEAL